MPLQKMITSGSLASEKHLNLQTKKRPNPHNMAIDDWDAALFLAETCGLHAEITANLTAMFVDWIDFGGRLL